MQGCIVWCLTMRESELDWLGGVSEVPQGQAAVWVTAHELLPFMMPACWMDGLHQEDRHMSRKNSEWMWCANFNLCFAQMWQIFHEIQTYQIKSIWILWQETVKAAENAITCIYILASACMCLSPLRNLLHRSRFWSQPFWPWGPTVQSSHSQTR